MKAKLREDDRRAIDVLLDRAAAAAGKAPGASVYAAADVNLRQRVASVEKVLGVLDNLVSSEPPRNLVSRTLRFVESSTGAHFGRTRESHPGAYNNPSHPA